MSRRREIVELIFQSDNGINQLYDMGLEEVIFAYNMANQFASEKEMELEDILFFRRAAQKYDDIICEKTSRKNNYFMVPSEDKETLWLLTEKKLGKAITSNVTKKMECITKKQLHSVCEENTYQWVQVNYREYGIKIPVSAFRNILMNNVMS